MDAIRHLSVQMATANRDWGYTRIRDALSNLGYTSVHSALRWDQLLRSFFA